MCQTETSPGPVAKKTIFCLTANINLLGRGRACSVQAMAANFPLACCLHLIIEADGGSHHICGAADDLEGKMVGGAAPLVPALVPGQLLACEGRESCGGGDTGHSPGPGAGAWWSLSGCAVGVMAGPASSWGWGQLCV